jgi:hypothetical protein
MDGHVTPAVLTTQTLYEELQVLVRKYNGLSHMELAGVLRIMAGLELLKLEPREIK